MLAEWAQYSVAEGRPYAISERLLWLIVRRLEENTVVVGKALGNKKLKLAKTHPDYPWSETDTGRVRIGGRGGATSEEVIDFLDSK